MRYLKQILALLLSAVLLTACAAPAPGATTAANTLAPTPTTTAAAPTETTVPPTTEATIPPEEAARILAERRDMVEAEMRRMMDVRWRSTEDFTYSKASNAGTLAMEKATNAENIVEIKAGRVYAGLPYGHGSGSGYSWLSFAESQDANGVYTLSGITSELVHGGCFTEAPNLARLSNDCADAVFWAWGQVSTSITFTSTIEMTEQTGCVRVGEYTASASKNAKTKEVCKENGTDVMFAAYAQMQKGDAVVQYNSAGHAMMVADVHVVMNGNTIDGEQSYALILEQTSSYVTKEKFFFDEKLQENVYICGGVDVKYTFNKLFKTGYLPITCKELVDPSPLAEVTMYDSEAEKGLTKDNICKGMFKSNYRISSVTVTIADSNGNTVQQATAFGHQGEMNRFLLSRLNDKTEAPVRRGSLDVKALTPGTYHCTHTCQIATGEILTVRDFTFTIS